MAEPRGLVEGSLRLDYDRARNASLSRDRAQVIYQEISPKTLHSVGHPGGPGRMITPKMLVCVNAYVTHINKIPESGCQNPLRLN